MRFYAVMFVVGWLSHAAADSAKKGEAAMHFLTGKSDFDAGRYAEAVNEFGAGYSVWPRPEFLVNLGQCYRRMGQLEEARTAFHQYLLSTEDSPRSRLRAEVKQSIIEIDAALKDRAAAEKRVQMEAERRTEELARQHERENLAKRAMLASLTPVAVSTDSATTTKTEAALKKRRWVWAVVGVLVATVAASAITLGVVYGRADTPAMFAPGR